MSLVVPAGSAREDLATWHFPVASLGHVGRSAMWSLPDTPDVTSLFVEYNLPVASRYLRQI